MGFQHQSLFRDEFSINLGGGASGEVEEQKEAPYAGAQSASYREKSIHCTNIAKEKNRQSGQQRHFRVAGKLFTLAEK